GSGRDAARARAVHPRHGAHAGGDVRSRGPGGGLCPRRRVDVPLQRPASARDRRRRLADQPARREIGERATIFGRAVDAALLELHRSPVSGVLSFSWSDDFPAWTVVRQVAGAGGQRAFGPFEFCTRTTTSAISSLSARSMSPSLSKSSSTAQDARFSTPRRPEDSRISA